jgi:hypothetical protein
MILFYFSKFLDIFLIIYKLDVTLFYHKTNPYIFKIFTGLTNVNFVAKNIIVDIFFKFIKILCPQNAEISE